MFFFYKIIRVTQDVIKFKRLRGEIYLLKWILYGLDSYLLQYRTKILSNYAKNMNTLHIFYKIGCYQSVCVDANTHLVMITELHVSNLQDQETL